MILKFTYFIAPVAAMLLGNIFIYSLILTRIESREMKTVVSACLGLLLFAGLLKLIPFLAVRAEISVPDFSNFKSAWIGVAVGFAVSGLSGYFYAAKNSKEINWSIFRSQVPYSAVAAISPATVEEATFRFGIVHGATFLAGPTVGSIVGSIPFGLGHLLDRLTGKTVSLEQAYGIILAGLLLSVLYLNYGIWAAIGCHWVWNTFASPWVKGMKLNSSSGMSDFEGAYSTSFILLFATLLIFSIGYFSSRVSVVQ